MQVLRAQRRPARRRADRRGLRGDRRPVPRHTAHRQPAAAPGPRLRRGRGRRPGHPARSPRPRSRSTTSTTSAWTGWTGPCSRPWSCASAAGRSGVATLAVAVGEEPNTVEEVCEPFLVRAGLLARTAAGPGGHRGGVAASGPAVAPWWCLAGWGRWGDQWRNRCTARPRVRRQSPCSAHRLRTAGAQLVRPRPCASRPVARARRAPERGNRVPERSRTGPAPTAEQHAR